MRGGCLELATTQKNTAGLALVLEEKTCTGRDLMGKGREPLNI